MKTNNEKYKAFEKVRRTIEGCTTFVELQVAERMADNFLKEDLDGYLTAMLYWYVLEKVKEVAKKSKILC